MVEHVIAGGARLELARIPGAEPTLVLLHEGLGSLRLWKRVPQELAERTGHAIVTYSRRGHGGSARLERPHAVSFMHDEARVVLPELLDALALRDVILVGHSDGASIALIHAAARAGRARAVVAMAPHVFVEPISTASIQAARARFLAADGDLPRKLARYHDDPAHTFFAWNDIWLDPQFESGWNLERLLPDVDVPVLVIQGRDDEYGTTRQCDAIAAGAGADVLLLSACGHAPHRDRPRATLDAIAGFVRRVSAPAPPRVTP